MGDLSYSFRIVSRISDNQNPSLGFHFVFFAFPEEGVFFLAFPFFFPEELFFSLLFFGEDFFDDLLGGVFSCLFGSFCFTLGAPSNLISGGMIGGVRFMAFEISTPLTEDT